jgi:hypothetical protein
MEDFTDIVPLRDGLERGGIRYQGLNFEEIYSELPNDGKVRLDIEQVVFEYFSALRLPAHPTIYDCLVLSLRKKDVIATFNWDPFLIQAIRRNLVPPWVESPKVLFLHGNVAAGYCARDRVHGERDKTCSRCGDPFGPSKLLYPTTHKDYSADPAISDAWRAAEQAFRAAFMVTIFGYGAPKSDVDAIDLLQGAWGGPDKRSMEQFEIVDVRDEDDLVRTWSGFIHSHHYEVHKSIFDSWLFRHPRRTGEAYLNQYVDAKFIKDHAIPEVSSLEGLWRWFRPLFNRENGAA